MEIVAVSSCKCRKRFYNLLEHQVLSARIECGLLPINQFCILWVSYHQPLMSVREVWEVGSWGHS